MYVFTELLNYLKLERRSLRAIFTYSTLSSLLLLGIPFFIQILVNQYSLLAFQTSTLFILFLIGIFLAGIALTHILQMHLSERLQRRILLRTIDRAKQAFLNSRSKDQKFTHSKWNHIFEAVNLQKTVVPLLLDGFVFALQAILVLIIVIFYHPFFIIYSLFIVAGLYFIIVRIGKRTAQLSLYESKAKYIMIEKLQAFSNLEQPEQTTTAELDASLDEYFRKREIRYQSYFKQSMGLILIKIIAAMVLIFVGGLLVIKNQMTIGQLVASELIITNLLISLFKFSRLLDYFYDSMVSVHKINTHYGVESTPGDH